MVPLSPIAVALAIAAPAQAEGRPQTLEFAAARFGGWRAKAETEVDYGRIPGDVSLPSVSEVRCGVVRNGLSVLLDRRGNPGIILNGNDPKAGEEDNRQFSTGTVRWLAIDGQRLEARPVHTGNPRWKFDDVAYPRIEDENVILPLFSGHLEVRRNASEPWLPLSSLLGRLTHARRLTIGHGHMIDGRVPKVHALDVPLAGLGDALLWCQRQIESAAAYRYVHAPPPPASRF